VDEIHPGVNSHLPGLYKYHKDKEAGLNQSSFFAMDMSDQQSGRKSKLVCF